MLEFEKSWRFNSPGAISDKVYWEFHGLISMMAGGKQSILETFKIRYAAAARSPYSKSSDASWADSDLQSYMGDAAKNAPVFIEAFYDGLEAVRDKVPVPAVADINRILATHHAGYEIVPPYLYTMDGEIAPMQAPIIPLSFDDQAKEIIEKSLNQADSLLKDKQARPAVQELLWLLETITTAFEGLTTENSETIGGKYFNKIIPELRKVSKGSATDQILGWIQTLHGYLSAPKGGRMRHGADLKDGVVTSSAEARLYYNLTLSYIDYLMSEYDRLSKTMKPDNWH